jgi:hypothetical protein
MPAVSRDRWSRPCDEVTVSGKSEAPVEMQPREALHRRRNARFEPNTRGPWFCGRCAALRIQASRPGLSWHSRLAPHPAKANPRSTRVMQSFPGVGSWDCTPGGGGIGQVQKTAIRRAMPETKGAAELAQPGRQCPPLGGVTPKAARRVKALRRAAQGSCPSFGSQGIARSAGGLRSRRQHSGSV